MDYPSRPSRRQVLHGYLVLPHAVPILVVLVATIAFALIASEGWPGLVPFATLMGAIFGSQIAIGAVNELVDAELDALARPTKPIPAGLVSHRGAWTMTSVGLIVMVVLNLPFGLTALAICTLGTGVGIAYSLWFKRTTWSWVPYVLALPLLPIWVWTALDTVPPALLAIYPLGVGAIVAVNLAQSVPDIRRDRENGVRTPAVALGEGRAQVACWGALVSTALLAAIFAPWVTEQPGRVAIAALIAGALVALNALLWRHDARRGTMACFPCVAAGVVVLGVGWTLALLNG